jgi:hypothetical protein
VAAHCLVHAVNNAIGSQIITYEQLQETRRVAEHIQICGLKGRTSTPHDKGWFSVTDFNTWADDMFGSGIVLELLGTHKQGHFEHSLNTACQRKAEQTNCTWADFPNLRPQFLVMRNENLEGKGHFVAIIRANGR